MDTLVVLRDYASGGRSRKDITNENGSFVVFDDVAYAKNAATALFHYGKPTTFYTMEALLFLWDNRHLGHPVYVRTAAGAGIMAVTRMDRREILEFLTGEREHFPVNHDPYAPYPETIPLSAFPELGEPERKKPKLEPGIMTPAIDHLLNEGPSMQAPVETGQLRDLNEQLTVDKIAALRAKRKLNQLKTLTQNLDDPCRERVWRTRDNCLEAGGLRNFSNILTTLQGLLAREEALRLKLAPNNAPAAPPSDPRSAAVAARQVVASRSRSAGYSRYDQEQFNTTSEFGVEGAEATFVGKSLAQFLQSSQAPVPSAPAVATPGPPAARACAPDSKRKVKPSSRTPIIIIPSGSASVITMLNAQDLLQDMRFVSNEEKKAAGVRRESECLLQRRKGQVTVPYRVVDNPLKLNDDEWERVVAVFAMGPAWQFKGWRWGGNPVDIFANVAAFHVMYDDVKLDPNIAKWSVDIIRISRTKRHLDKARLVEFWNNLDRHIMKTKPHLRF